MIRYVGLDLHKEFIQMCILDEGGKVIETERIGTQCEELTKWREKLGKEDQVAFESCTFAWAVYDILEGRVGRIVVSNAYKTRAIAEARIKSDKVDARSLNYSGKTGPVNKVDSRVENRPRRMQIHEKEKTGVTG